MKQLYIFILIVMLGLVNNLSAQTVVKMPLPQQAELPLTVEVLFDEALPGNIPSAIGIIGYDITGGTAPYSYFWLEDETILKQSETLLLQPKAGKSYALRINDENNCAVVVPITISGNKSGHIPQEEKTGVQMMLTKQQLRIVPTKEFEGSMDVYLMNVLGQRLVHVRISGETEIPLNLAPGSYLVLQKYGDQYHVSKHMLP
jgi:hypothetical protein